MRFLLAAAVVFFLIAAISAFSTSVNANVLGFIALGLTCWAGDQLADGLGATWHRAPGRSFARRGVRRPL